MLQQVWIYKSRLHLVPLPFISPKSSKHSRRRIPGATDSDDEALGGGDNAEDYLDIADALKLVRDPNIDTTAPSEVQVLVWEKVQRYANCFL